MRREKATGYVSATYVVTDDVSTVDCDRQIAIVVKACKALTAKLNDRGFTYDTKVREVGYTLTSRPKTVGGLTALFTWTVDLARQLRSELLWLKEVEFEIRGTAEPPSKANRKCYLQKQERKQKKGKGK